MEELQREERVAARPLGDRRDLVLEEAVLGCGAHERGRGLGGEGRQVDRGSFAHRNPTFMISRLLAFPLSRSRAP